MPTSRAILVLAAVSGALATGAVGLGVLGCVGRADRRRSAGGPPAIEAPDLDADAVRRLQRLERLFRAAAESYAAERTKALADDERNGPWLAKLCVKLAIDDYDRMLRAGVAVSRFLTEEPPTDLVERDLFRARDELLVLGDDGRRAIVHYMLRSRRGQLRELALILLVAQPHRELFALLTREIALGTGPSKRAALGLLARLGHGDEVRRVLADASKSRDWQTRAAALVPLARVLGARGEAEAPATFWRIHREDDDEFVRRQALLALATLDRADQVRPLVERLGELLVAERLSEAEACGEALRKLTGKNFGTRHGAWQAWLGS